MSSINLIINGVSIPGFLIEEITISYDMTSLCPEASIILDDSTQGLYLALLAGAPVTITLQASDGGVSQIPFRVLSYSKSSTNTGGTAISHLEIKCVHDWWWGDGAVNSTKVLYGSVSSIIENLLREDLNEFFPIGKYDIESSDDLPLRRFQTTTDYKFINHIKEFSYKEKSPMYAWIDPVGVFHFKSVESLNSSSSLFSLKPFSINSQTGIGQEYPANNSSSTGLPVISITDINLGNESTVEEYSQTRFRVFFEELIAADKARSSRWVIENSPDAAVENTNQVSLRRPGDLIYSNEFLPPSDQMGKFLHKCWESDAKNLYVIANVAGIPTFSLSPGKRVTLELPHTASNEKGTWPGEGEYLIKYVSYIWTSEVIITKLQLVSIR